MNLRRPTHRKSVVKCQQSSHTKHQHKWEFLLTECVTGKCLEPSLPQLILMPLKMAQWKVHAYKVSIINFFCFFQGFEVSATSKLDLTTQKCVKNPFVWQSKPGSLLGDWPNRCMNLLKNTQDIKLHLTRFMHHSFAFTSYKHQCFFVKSKITGCDSYLDDGSFPQLLCRSLK